VIDTTIRKKKSGLMDFVIGSDSEKNSINQEVYEEFRVEYAKCKIDDPITLKIKTHGGDLFYSLLIANILRNHQGKIHCIIDQYAMSGGSLVALACNTISMTNVDAMGPIDPQLYGILSAKDVINALGQKEEKNTFETLLHSASKGCVNGYLPLLKKILLKNHSQDAMEEIIDKFFFPETDHSTIITVDELDFLTNLNQKK